MTDIPASLLIRPSEARERFTVALRGLVKAFGCKAVAYQLRASRETVWAWSSGRREPRYSKAIEVIAWYDRELVTTTNILHDTP